MKSIIPPPKSIVPENVPETIETEEIKEEETITKPKIISLSSRRWVPRQGIESFTHAAMHLMPVRCYTCNKVLKQVEIENALKSGKNLRDVLDELKYRKICCKMRIMSSIPIVQLQKELETKKLIETKLEENNLTLEDTGSIENVEFPIVTGTKIRILDNYEPGMMENQYCSQTTEEPTNQYTDAYDLYINAFNEK